MEKDRKHYDKEIPLAVHAKELAEKVINNRLADYRDLVARSIITASNCGYKSNSFNKFPPEHEIETGYTPAIYNQVYQELVQKGYKLDYSGDSLRVSWD